MVPIWKNGGTLERAGLLLAIAAIVSCLFDIVDFEALPKTVDKLTIAFPMMVVAAALILGGQRLRHRAEDRKRGE